MVGIRTQFSPRGNSNISKLGYMKAKAASHAIKSFFTVCRERRLRKVNTDIDINYLGGSFFWQHNMALCIASSVTTLTMSKWHILYYQLLYDLLFLVFMIGRRGIWSILLKSTFSKIPELSSTVSKNPELLACPFAFLPLI